MQSTFMSQVFDYIELDDMCNDSLYLLMLQIQSLDFWKTTFRLGIYFQSSNSSTCRSSR